MACDTSERTLTELRIARAYVRLSSIPENSPEASVSLASIGSYEIRMFRGRRSILMACHCFGWSCSITARKRLSTAAVATGSKTLCLYSTISSRRQIV